MSIIQVLVTISQMLTKTCLSWQIEFSINAILKSFCQLLSTVIDIFADHGQSVSVLFNYISDGHLFPDAR